MARFVELDTALLNVITFSQSVTEVHILKASLKKIALSGYDLAWGAMQSSEVAWDERESSIHLVL